MATLNTVSAIPVMTANTIPSGIASASSVYSSNDAFRAFDGVGNIWWQSANATFPCWISYHFVNPIVIGAYSIIGPGTPSQSPKNWTFEGSNDGVSWVVLDTRTNIEISTLEEKKFTFNNKTEYKTYRIHITQNNGNPAYTSIAEIKMFEVIFTNKVLFSFNNEILSCNNATLLTVPSISEDNFLNHGMNKTDEVDLLNIMTNKAFVEQTSTTVDNGKVFKKVINPINIPVKSITVE